MKILNEIMALDRAGMPVAYRDLLKIHAEVEKMEARAHLATLQANVMFRAYKDRLEEVGRLHLKLRMLDRAVAELSAMNAAVTEEQALARGGCWVSADDLRGLIKDLDVALNGAGGAQRPRLADIVSQAEILRCQWGAPLFEVLRWAPTTSSTSCGPQASS